MKSRGLEKTSPRMLTLSLSSLLPLPCNHVPPLISNPNQPPSFCCFFQSLTRLSPHAFSPPPPPPPPHTFSLSLLTFWLSHHLSPPLLSTPTHSWYSTDLSGQLYDRSAERADTEGNTLRAAAAAVHAARRCSNACV